MSATIIWTDWGDPDSLSLECMWWHVDVNLIHITKWTESTKKIVNYVLSHEKDTLMFCGHGTKFGLIAPNFENYEYVIHQYNVANIAAKNIIGVSCHAKEFAQSVGLHGFFTDMFITNIDEALNYSVQADQKDINCANGVIYQQINKMLLGNIDMQQCLDSLKNVNTKNPVTQFNIDGIDIL